MSLSSLYLPTLYFFSLFIFSLYLSTVIDKPSLSSFFRKTQSPVHVQPRTIVSGPQDLLSSSPHHPSTMPVNNSANILPYLARKRAHFQNAWLNSHQSFNVPGCLDLNNLEKRNGTPDFDYLGPISILNEDRVAPLNGFPSHYHRDYEIFSYVLAGELTHRDSTMQKAGREAAGTNKFYCMKRGDVQFTSAGSGVAHSEVNESSDGTCHFLQIWVSPWAKGLKPIYHHGTFPEEEKKKGFVTIISPLKGGIRASKEQEAKAEPVVQGTIPVHADLLFGAGIIAPGKTFVWNVGGADAVKAEKDRKVYVYLPQLKGGQSQISLNGDESILSEGDGAFITSVNARDEISFTSIGKEEAEVVVLDANPN